MSTIKGPPPSGAGFEKLSQNLNKAAESLKETAQTLDPAAARAVLTTSKFVEGVSETASQAATGAFIAAGVRGWVADGIAEGARYVAKGAARGLGAIAADLARFAGDGKQVTVKELQGDPSARRFSERMFGKAAAKLQQGSDAMNAAWAAYGEALQHVSAELGARNVSSVAGGLAKAAALSTSSAATRLAELGVRIGAAAVQAAEAGAANVRGLLQLSARHSAVTANVLANPDQSSAAAKQLEQSRAELETLLAK
ncbi:MAG: hypothetical protein JNK82_20985 [Myxococcaceae bacterium]|nr:hypothetical protein [Myxococcaceae bacterium]